MTWRNDHFIFGGYKEKTQISKIIDCKLTNLGHLKFDFKSGACTNVAESRLYLCFNDGTGDYKQCWSGPSPVGSYTKIAESAYEHGSSFISSGKGQISQV